MKKKEIIIILVGVAVVSAVLIYFGTSKEKEVNIGGGDNCITGGSFTVDFETNGGDEIESMGVCIACSPDSYDAMPTAKKEGYTFEGWYYDEALTKKVDGDTMLAVESNPITEGEDCITGYNSVKLYAKYTEETKKEENKPTETKKEETKVTYSCPSGYTLSGDKCSKTVTQKGTASCPSGAFDVSGKCVLISGTNRVDPGRECGTWTYTTGGGHTESAKGELMNAGYYYCVYGEVTGSQYQTQAGCQTAYIWANNKCWYAKTGASENINYTCSSGYTYVSNPNSYSGVNGQNAGCFKNTDYVVKCQEGYTGTLHPVDGAICSKTVTIDATKN